MTGDTGHIASGAADVHWDAGEKPMLVDPADTTPFNPLDTANLAIAVVRALLEKRVWPLGALPEFRGAGIYAIYYRGSFAAYSLIAGANREPGKPRWPIYVGKAIPEGGRKGGKFTTDPTTTRALCNRLGQHADSIREVENLDIADFGCRFLVVDYLWIPLAEGLLITHFTPLWNSHIDGFGNHNPGFGRVNGKRPRWDTLHPGRYWAHKFPQRSESLREIELEIEERLRTTSAPSLVGFTADASKK